MCLLLKIITVGGQCHWLSLETQRHCYNVNDQSLLILTYISGYINIYTNDTTNLTNMESSSGVDTNRDSDSLKIEGMFGLCG